MNIEHDGFGISLVIWPSRFDPDNSRMFRSEITFPPLPRLLPHLSFLPPNLKIHPLGLNRAITWGYWGPSKADICPRATAYIRG